MTHLELRVIVRIGEMHKQFTSLMNKIASLTRK
jgi:hypothetical protein